MTAIIIIFSLNYINISETNSVQCLLEIPFIFLEYQTSKVSHLGPAFIHKTRKNYDNMNCPQNPYIVFKMQVKVWEMFVNLIDF